MTNLPPTANLTVVRHPYGAGNLHLTKLRTFTLTIVWGLSLAGCGGNDGPIRVPLQGMVTSTDIRTHLKGTIALLPTGETRGPAANGLVVNGIYSFTEERGPVPGQHRVLIDVEPPRGKMVDAGEQAALQWKFEFQTTVPSEPPFTADFQLIRETTDESVE